MAAGTVLVVDDDPSIRRSLERLLRAAGYTVQTFTSSWHFLERGDVDGAGCLVLDVRMPGPSGLDVQQVLERSGRRIPVIFITGHADPSATQQAMQAGAVEVLTKPFDGEVLLGVIARVFATGGARRERPAPSGGAPSAAASPRR